MPPGQGERLVCWSQSTIANTPQGYWEHRELLPAKETWVAGWGGGVCPLLQHSQAYGILVSWPGIEPGPSAVKAQNPNHWTVREFLLTFHFAKKSPGNCVCPCLLAYREIVPPSRVRSPPFVSSTPVIRSVFFPFRSTEVPPPWREGVCVSIQEGEDWGWALRMRAHSQRLSPENAQWRSWGWN